MSDPVIGLIRAEDAGSSPAGDGRHRGLGGGLQLGLPGPAEAASSAVFFSFILWYVPMWRGCGAWRGPGRRVPGRRLPRPQPSASGPTAATPSPMMVQPSSGGLCAEEAEPRPARQADELETVPAWTNTGFGLPGTSCWPRWQVEDARRPSSRRVAPLRHAMTRESEGIPVMAQVAETIALTAAPVARSGI